MFSSQKEESDLMKIYAIYIFRRNGDKAQIIDTSSDFTDISRLYRKNVKELCDFAATQLAASPDTTQFVSARDDQIPKCIFHKFRKDDAVSLVVVDEAYPSRSAFNIVREVMQEYEGCRGNFPGGHARSVQEGIRKYQDPKNADKIEKIKANLEETRDIMVQNMEKALARGETLEQMADKSEQLSKDSKMFARQAKKMNGCCS